MAAKFPVIDKLRTGQQIRNLMILSGLTVTDIQKFLGLSTLQAVYHWFSGRSLPTIDNIYALSELFQVPMDDIICGSRTYRPGPGYYRLMAYASMMGYGC